MAGIVFARTRQREALSAFYRERLGFTLWLPQPDIDILRHDNLLLGLHQTDAEPDLDLLICLVYPHRADVDRLHTQLADDVATTEPRVTSRYHIYHFFGRDPEGRKLEVQAFDHELPMVGPPPRGWSDG